MIFNSYFIFILPIFYSKSLFKWHQIFVNFFLTLISKNSRFGSLNGSDLSQILSVISSHHENTFDIETNSFISQYRFISNNLSTYQVNNNK